METEHIENLPAPCNPRQGAWLRPVRCSQQSLFPRPKEEFLALVHVSPDELKRWRQLGWISFDVDSITEFHTPEEYETGFVRNIARSGLSDFQINELLAELPKPYSYDHTTTAYSFLYGWVRMPPQPEEADVFEVIEENLDEWAKAQVEEGNAERIYDLLGNAVRLALARKDPEKAEREKSGEP